jgi:PKD repeat protein
VGEIVTFNGSSSSDPDGNVLTYLWDFGDGQTGSGVNAMHTYNKAGQYAVSLTVSDGQYSDTAYAQVVVNEKSAFNLGGTTALYIGLGAIALLLLVLIIVMLTRKQPPRIYSSR